MDYAVKMLAVTALFAASIGFGVGSGLSVGVAQVGCVLSVAIAMIWTVLAGDGESSARRRPALAKSRRRRVVREAGEG